MTLTKKFKLSQELNENSFWKRIRKYASKIGCPLLCKALTLFYTFKDPDTPKWAKTTILGALGYLISLVDAIPDFIPGIGYTDDLGVIAAAIAAVAFYIKDDHKKKADETIQKILSDCHCSQQLLEEDQESEKEK